MTQTLMADVNHVHLAIEKVSTITGIHDDSVSIEVYDADVVMRGITREEARNRNLFHTLDHPLCSLTYDGTEWTLKFHERMVQETFKLRPAGTPAFDPNQATDPDLLCPDLVPLVEALEDRFNVISWDFTKVSAASIASAGHFTDFEFEYVITGL